MHCSEFVTILISHSILQLQGIRISIVPFACFIAENKLMNNRSPTRGLGSGRVEQCSDEGDKEFRTPTILVLVPNVFSRSQRR